MATVAFTGVPIDLDAWGYDRKCRNPEAYEISADVASTLLSSKDKSVTMFVASLLVHIVNSSAHHSDRHSAV